MDSEKEQIMVALWARYRRIMRYLLVAVLLPVALGALLIYRNERLFAAKLYIGLGLVAAFAMILASIWLIMRVLHRK